MSEIYLLSLGMFVLLICVGASILIAAVSFYSSKSQAYRKFLTNMYIASKVRQLASKDDLDLNLESENFKDYERQVNTRDKDLDKTIEEDLKVNIGETYKKENKPKKK